MSSLSLPGLPPATASRGPQWTRRLIESSSNARRQCSAWPGGPAQPCDENMRWNPYEFPLIAGRFARGCSPSDIYSDLVSPGNAWWLGDKVVAGGTAATPATLATE